MDARLEVIRKIVKSLEAHWEDPEWGKRGSNQVMYNTVIYELAGNIKDTAARE